MKTWKKFFALALALILCLAMAVPALAAEGDKTLTMKDPTPDHTYNVYQIFTGDVYTGEGNGLGLANVKYGKNYHPAPNKEGDAVDEAFLKTIQDAEQFAKDNASAIIVAGNEPVAKITSNDNWTVTVAPGYYMIVDAGINDGTVTDPENDVMSAYIVEVVGDTTITPKTTTPSLDKEVENEDGEFGANADHAIGETFQFKLTARVPVEYLAKYDEYFLKFSDTMSAGITFEKIAGVQVTGGNPIPAAEGETAGYVLARSNDANSFSVTIEDLFQFIGTNSKDWPIKTITTGEGEEETTEDVVEIIVTYDVHLNENAKVTNAGGEAEHENNKANLEYSNDPNSDGTGKTTETDTEVYSIQLDITKYSNSVNDDNLLAGAGFTLYEADGETVIPLYYKEGANGIYYVWNGDLAEKPGDLLPVEAVEGVNKANEIITDGTGHFVINGLDVGTYVLKETTTPTGYNTIDDITIEITASYVEAEGKTNLVLKHTKDGGDPVDGTKLDVINTTGSLLPSTGGMGTTLLYVVGGLLVVGAAVTLVVRKSVRRRS